MDFLKAPFITVRSDSPLLYPETITASPTSTTMSAFAEKLDQRGVTASPLFKESPNHPTGSKRNSIDHQQRQQQPPRSGRLPRTPELGGAASRLLQTPEIGSATSRRGSGVESVSGSISGLPSPRNLSPVSRNVGSKKRR